MQKLILPALGAALVLGVPAASAQLMLPGQPGYTTSNRPLAPGVTGPNIPGSYLNVPSPYQTGPTSAAGPQQSPRFGQPGDLNRAEIESVTPGEPDASGRIGPTVDRSRARFAGERGPDGKLLPTYLPSQAQVPQSAPPQTPAQTDERMRSGQTPPAQRDMQGGTPNQPQTLQPQRDRRSQMAPGSSQSGQGQMGQSGSPSQRDPSQMQRRSQSGAQDMQGQRPMQQRDRQPTGARQSAAEPPDATAMLNVLSAQGYRPTSNFRREGNVWAGSAVKDGRQVTVLYDPSTQRVSER